MPGLFGIFSKNGRLSRDDLLSMGRRMADSMRRLPWMQADIWGDETFCGGRVHLGVLNPEPQPFAIKSGAACAWIDGQCFPPDREIDAKVDGDFVWRLASDCGKSLSRVDGVFNLACYDSADGNVVLANDRLGFRPLYYTETPDWFAYAGEVKALLVIRDKLPNIDQVSLRQFFGFEHLIGERTWWDGVEVFPPASVWRISRKGAHTSRYWTFDDITLEPRSEEDLSESFGRLWSADIRRHLKPGTMPLLLSGGLDSRFLLAELLEQGADVVAVTFGSSESPEMIGARRHVIPIAGIPHRLCYLDTNNWWHRREEAIWQTDGLFNANHLHYVSALDEMHTGNSYSLVNILGDMLFGGSDLDRRLMGTDWRAAPHKLLTAQNMNYRKNPFFSRDEGIEASIDDANRYVDGPSSSCFYLRQQYRRYKIHISLCLVSHCEVVFPGIGHGFLKLFLGSLSEGQRFGSRFYNRFLAARYPEYFANIPWEITGRGLAESFGTKVVRDVQTQFHRVLRYLGNGTRRLPRMDQWFVDYPRCVERSRFRERLLSAELLSDQILDGRVSRALKNNTAGSLRAQDLIAMFTFETYLRQVAGMPSVPEVSSPKSELLEASGF